MIKKIIVFGLLAAGAFLFYKNFMADTFEPFFKGNKGKVDFFGHKTPDYKEATLP